MTSVLLDGLDKRACQAVIAFSQSIDSYRDNPDDVRFCRLLDRIKLMLQCVATLKPLMEMFASSALSGEPELINNAMKAVENIVKEVEDLEKYILGKRQTEYTNIVQKLDEVLLGPDYGPGQQMMKRARVDFEGRSQKP